ncbi:MAG: hypothetical protein FJW56_00195 [Actinobacteria bacterium]|nr:hypothetical protein [Actinomycetota bacterium]
MNEQNLKELIEAGKIKGSERIQINNLLAAISMAILVLIIGLEKIQFSPWAITQLSFSIPLLVTSSLAYSKSAYRENSEYFMWDRLGWFAHTLGYSMILNSIFLILYFNFDHFVALMFLSITIVLHILYSVIDYLLKKSRLLEKSTKLFFYVLIFFLGSILPVLL